METLVAHGSLHCSQEAVLVDHVSRVFLFLFGLLFSIILVC